MDFDLTSILGTIIFLIVYLSLLSEKKQKAFFPFILKLVKLLPLTNIFNALADFAKYLGKKSK